MTLANPSVVADTSWVRPGKVMRINSLTTASALTTVDFAAGHGLQYVEFDSGWYGSEFSTSSNPLVPIAAIDMPQVVSYGAAKGIGVLVYVNQLALSTTSQAQQIMSTYQQYIVMAGRSGTTWYVGVLTNEQGRTVDVPLNFLGSGQWQATIYADSPPGTAITNPTGVAPESTPIVISQQTVTAATTLHAAMTGSGGQAIMLQPR